MSIAMFLAQVGKSSTFNHAQHNHLLASGCGDLVTQTKFRHQIIIDPKLRFGWRLVVGFYFANLRAGPSRNLILIFTRISQGELCKN